MELHVYVIKEWTTRQNGNRAKLLTSLCTSQILLSTILDSYSGRHWELWCAVIHAVFTDRFADVASRSYTHSSLSVHHFASTLPKSLLASLIRDLSTTKELFGELISFHNFKQFAAPAFLSALFLSAADLLSLLLMIENARETAFQVSSFSMVSEYLPAETNNDSSELSPVTSVNSTDVALEQVLQLEEEQSLIDSAMYEDFVQGNGYFH
jgi:hypothetical protein